MTRRGLFGALAGSAAAPKAKAAPEPRASIYGNRYLLVAWHDAQGQFHNAQIDLKYCARTRKIWAQLEAGFKTKAQVMRELGLDGRGEPLDEAG